MPEEETAAARAATGRRRKTKTSAALNKPSQGYPGYLLCLESPVGEYDVTYDVEKTLIEFLDWDRPLALLLKY